MVRPDLGKVFKNYATSDLTTCPIVSYLPLGITETLKNEFVRVWGGEGGGEGGGEVKRRERRLWAVGRAASVSEAHVRSSVAYVYNGVTPSAVTQSCQAWARSLRIMPPTI